MDAKDVKIEIPQIQRGEALDIMIGRQIGLYQSYVKIEKLPPYPWDLRLKDSQTLFKSFLFRFIEELAEAYESYLNGDMQNYYTELADATHFLLEAWIVAGLEVPQNYWEAIWATDHKLDHVDNLTLTKWFWQSTYHAGLVSNTLRNKIWKQTQVLPDFHMFHRAMKDTFIVFFTGFRQSGMTEQQVLEWYIRKNEVNLFRIRSNY